MDLLSGFHQRAISIERLFLAQSLLFFSFFFVMTSISE